MKVYCIGCKRLLSRQYARRSHWYCKECRRQAFYVFMAATVVELLQDPAYTAEVRRFGEFWTQEVKILQGEQP